MSVSPTYIGRQNLRFLRPCLIGIALLLPLSAASARASIPSDPALRSQLVGRPLALVVQPESITLAGLNAHQQIVVTGRYADGSARDLTPFAELTIDKPGCLEVGSDGFLAPRKNGTATLIVKAGGQSVRVPVTVNSCDAGVPVSFRHQLIAALNVGGCNAGACHGTPSGKNGFRLSLRGYDPASDYIQLTRDVLGRRTARQGPDSSLILKKALGKVPHEGGQRYSAKSVPAQMISHWLAEGLKDDPANLPALKQITVLPGTRLLHAPARWQQLAVLGHFADGTVRDVTRLTVFSSSDSNIADVSATGLV